MPRFAKWLIHVAPHTPVDRVARQALATRLRAVAWYLDQSTGKGEAEAIHQLRIWTRRTGAALRLFAPALPERPVRSLKKLLRKLRRRAGAVRDCDVHAEQLRSDSAQPPRRLLNELQEQRQAARRKLKALRRRWRQSGRLERRFAAVLDAVAWPKRHSSRDAPPFAPWCRAELLELGRSFFALAALDPADDGQLHELRKAGKRMRYALELGAAVLAPRNHRRLYDEFSRLQDRLGAVCDRLVSVERYRDWLAASKRKHREEFAELLAHEEQRLAAARRQFRRWWSAARRERCQRQWLKAAGA